jgi:hypothetical protein
MAPRAHAWSAGAPGRRPEPARRRRDGVVALQQGVGNRVREVADIGRPAKVSDDVASLAGDSKRVQKHAASLVAFAKERKVLLKDVAEAMRAAASDSTPGDMVAAGGIYAIAAAAKLLLADDIKAGRIKVDEMPRSQIEGAIYVPTGKGRLEKGDTIYVKPSFDVSDLRDRGTAVHELEHARQDSKESASVLKDVSKIEPEAYVAGARYILEEIAALPDKKRPDAQKKMAEQLASFDMYAAVIAAKADTRLMPVLTAINGLRKKDDQLADDDFKKSDDELKERIVDRLGEHARGQVRMSGFAGESVFDLKRAQTK